MFVNISLLLIKHILYNYYKIYEINIKFNNNQETTNLLMLFHQIKFKSLPFIIKYNSVKLFRKKSISKQLPQQKTSNQPKYEYDHLPIQSPYKQIIQSITNQKVKQSQFIQIYDTYTSLSNDKNVFRNLNIEKGSFYSNMCDHTVKHNILDIQFRRIAKMQKLSNRNQSKINNFLLDMYNCVLGKFKYHKFIKKPLNLQQSHDVLKIIKKLKPFIYLVDDKEIQIFHSILRMYSLFRENNIHELDIFNSQKNAISILFEKIIYSPKPMRQQSFIHFAYFCARYGAYNMSSYIQKDVWSYILRNLPKSRQFNSQTARITKSILFSLGKQYYINSQVVIYFNSALKYISNSQQKFQDKYYVLKILRGSLTLRILNKQNYFKNYSQISRHILKERFSEQFLCMMHQFIMAQIWDFSIWKHFFKIFNDQHTINLGYKLKQVIFSIELLKDQIPVQIYQIYLQVLKTNQNIKKIKEMQLSEFKNQYKHLKEQKNFFQINLKKIFDLSKIQSLYEHQIQIFTVDIFIPKRKLIIEVHGPDHYIRNIDTQQNIDNLDTLFKKKIFNKLGYKFFEINIVNQVSPSKAANKILSQYQIVS